MSWYEMATYTIKDGSKIHLHIGDFITMQAEGYGECYAIIKAIFKHKGNDNKYYAFFIIDWFEDTNKIHHVLKCPYIASRQLKTCVGEEFTQYQ
jgi:hypothetical protein